ncbi:MAG: protease inhibitor I42 family protein [Actinomycetota bacterium]
MTARRLLAPALAVVLFAAACGGGGGDDDDAGGEIRAVSDPATPVQAMVGDVVEITLEANATTGFVWELSSQPETAVIRYIGGDYEARDEVVTEESDTEGEEPTVAGGGGVQRLRFQVVGAGATQIQLRYVQPWIDPPAPAATSSYTVRVSAAADTGDE